MEVTYCQPFCLGNEFCDIDSVQDSILEDMVSCSLSNKPSQFQKIWSILSDSLSYLVENMPACIAYIPSQGYHFKKWKAKQALYDASKCHTPFRDNNDKYYGIQHGLKKDFQPHVDISATYLWSQDNAKSQANKTLFDMGIIPVDGRVSTYGYLVDKTPHYTLFDTGASKAMLNKKFYEEHPILYQYSKYPIHVQPIQVANDQLMTVKEAIKFLISFGGHTFEIIVYLLPFSTSFDFFFGLKTVTEIEEKINYSKLEFKFKKRSIDITPSKDIHLPVGKTTAIDCGMVRKTSDLSDNPVLVKMKSQREHCLPQTLRVALVKAKYI